MLPTKDYWRKYHDEAVYHQKQEVKIRKKTLSVPNEVWKIFGLKSLKEKRRKKMVQSMPPSPTDPVVSFSGIYSKPQTNEDHHTVVKTTAPP
jgi:hypothetical protein